MFDRRLISNIDWPLFLILMAICLLGVVGIYSAARGYSETTEYWLRQLFWIGLGLGVAMVITLFDLRTIGNFSYYAHGAVVVMLLVLLFVDSGASAKVNRWFMVGSVAVQPSEFVKLTMVMAIAHYFRDSRRTENLGWRGMIFPTLIMLVPFFLIAQQPDLGTALLLVLIFIPLIIAAGLRPRIIAILALAGVLGIGMVVASFKLGTYQLDERLIRDFESRGFTKQALAEMNAIRDQNFFLKNSLRKALVSEGGASDRYFPLIEKMSFKPLISKVLRPYQQRRLLTFINPDEDPLGAGYHVIQSKVAIGSGGFWGKGYLNSTQGKLNFLPARHTDFLFSVFSEEWGLIGATTLIGLYVLLLFRGITIIFQTHDRFSAYVVLGVLAIVFYQVIINLGMVVGMLPVVGVPLPFFSYGGSSLITMMMGMGMIFNIRMRRFLWS